MIFYINTKILYELDFFNVYRDYFFVIFFYIRVDFILLMTHIIFYQ